MRFLNYGLLISILIIVSVVSAQDATPIPVFTDIPVPTVVPCVDPAVGPQNNRWQPQEDKCNLQESVVIGVSVSYPQVLGEQYPFTKAVMLKYINQVRRNFWEGVESIHGLCGPMMIFIHGSGRLILRAIRSSILPLSHQSSLRHRLIPEMRRVSW